MRNVARLKMGYYPLPVAEGVKLRSLLSFAGPTSVIDPCVGQGTALHLITSDAQIRRYGVELDAERARIASANGIETIQGNAFDAIAKPESFSLLYLNPPYDSEIGSVGNNRMERLFLEHTFRWLVMEGVLILVIPFERLHDCPGILSSHFARLSVFRMTDEIRSKNLRQRMYNRRKSVFKRETPGQGLARLVVMTQHSRGTRSVGVCPLSVGRLAILACIALVASVSADSICLASDNQPLQLPLLTTARQVHDLTPDQASLGYPVRLRGVVTFYDPYQEGHRALFIADSTGEVFIAPGAAPLLPLHAGSLVEVTGETDPGGFSPIVSHSNIRILPGSKPLPVASAVTVSQLLSGGKDSYWVALEGVVHSVEFDGMHVVVTVATPDGTISATTDKEDGANYSALVDSEIVIQGVAAPLVNARRQLTGVRLLFPGMKTLSVRTPAPADPFLLPTLPLSSLLQYSPHPASSHRIHVRGRVTLSWPGQTVCIVDKTAGLCIQTADRTQLREGDLIDVVGFLERKDYLPSMTAATLKRVESGRSVTPIEISAANAFEIGKNHAGRVSLAAHTDVSEANSFDTDRNGELVRIQGALVGKNRGLNGSTLLLSSDGIVFHAELPADAVKDAKQLNASWIDGSTVAVTGVFIGKVDERQAVRQEGIARIESFQILLRSPTDVHVISTPSWWNSEHTLEVLGLVVLIMIAVLGWVAILRRQVHRQTEIIRRSALHDPLTGLPNRALFLERLARSVARAKRHQDFKIAVLFIDIDNFKIVNDSLGHHAGDDLLVQVSQRIWQSLRFEDLVSRTVPGISSELKTDDESLARLGGDEFTVLLEDIREPSDGVRVAGRIQDLFKEPFVICSRDVSITVSIGVTTNSAHATAADLLRDADTAMYRAKLHGKAQCQVFDQAMHEISVNRLNLETDLRRALEKKEFRVYYQPIVALRTGNITGFEALLRWQRPEKGLVFPGDFIGVAEEMGLIVEIGTWVLRTACEQVHQWHLENPPENSLTMSVNVSARQFMREDLVTQVGEILRETQVDPTSITLEITESVAMDDAERTIAVVNELKKLGPRFSMDDFGTGYSSLSYLQRFPMDTLKIDRSFVSNLTNNPENREIVNTIIALARNLGINVVAEGTETLEEVNYLKTLDCEFAQGYFFSKPVDSACAQELLLRKRVCTW